MQNDQTSEEVWLIAGKRLFGQSWTFSKKNQKLLD